MRQQSEPDRWKNCHKKIKIMLFNTKNVKPISNFILSRYYGGGGGGEGRGGGGGGGGGGGPRER